MINEKLLFMQSISKQKDDLQNQTAFLNQFYV